MNLDHIKQEIENKWSYGDQRGYLLCCGGDYCDGSDGEEKLDRILEFIDRTAAETIKAVLAVKPEEKIEINPTRSLGESWYNAALQQWQKRINKL